jgi:hypothetical protein
VSLCLLAFNPSLSWYVGLSGILHGIWVGGALANVRCAQKSAYLLLLLVALKLLWEQLAGPLPVSEKNLVANIIVDAHLYGGLAGLLTGLFFTPQPISRQKISRVK